VYYASDKSQDYCTNSTQLSTPQKQVMHSATYTEFSVSAGVSSCFLAL